MQWKLIPKNALTISSWKPKVPLETWNTNGKTYTDCRQKHSSKGSHEKHKKTHYINTRKTSQIKKELNREDIIVMKVDKNKAMVLIDRKQGMDKVHKFQKENSISTIKPNPTTKFHKQIQKTINSCTQLVDKKKKDI